MNETSKFKDIRAVAAVFFIFVLVSAVVFAVGQDKIKEQSSSASRHTMDYVAGLFYEPSDDSSEDSGDVDEASQDDESSPAEANEGFLSKINPFSSTEQMQVASNDGSTEDE